MHVVACFAYPPAMLPACFQTSRGKGCAAPAKLGLLVGLPLSLFLPLSPCPRACVLPLFPLCLVPVHVLVCCSPRSTSASSAPVGPPSSGGPRASLGGSGGTPGRMPPAYQSSPGPQQRVPARCVYRAGCWCFSCGVSPCSGGVRVIHCMWKTGAWGNGEVDRW